MYPNSYDVPIARLVARQILSCAPATPVREVARRMFAERCSSIVVMKDEQVVGIWTEHDALSAGDNPRELDRPVSEVMSHPVLTLEANTPLGEAAMKFKQSGVRHFVVVRDGAAIGVLTQTDIVVNQGAEFFLHLKPIESIRVHPPVVVPEQTALHEVIARMRAQRLDAILVGYDDGEHGILTERDIVRLLADGGAEGAVGAYASRPLQMLTARQSLYAAQRFMTDHNVRHVGIRDDDDRLTGLLCFADVLQSIEHEYANELRSALRERDEALGLARFNLRMADRVFESALEGIMVTDRHAKIERVNQAFTRLTGYTEDEVVGRNPGLLSSGRQTPDFYKQLWHSLTIDGHWQGEIWNRRKTGELFLEYLTITSIRDSEAEISHYAAIFSDITQRRQAEERLGYLATHDVLTNLANRMLFEERLAHAIVHAKRFGRKVAVMYLDLDRFKLVNDTLGHNAGDEVLKMVAERIVANVRANDTVARMGGDEFALVI